MSPADPLLGRRPHRDRPTLCLWGEVRLPLARVHEVCGRSRRTLALRFAAATEGPVIWIAPAWGSDPLNACGVVPLLSPGRLLVVRPDRADDMLWSMEEALRTGCVPVVVADLSDPPGMTAVRRLHLAAEAAVGNRAPHRPLGLLLTSGEGGAPGIETRWQLEPAHLPGHDRWRLERLRARMAPPKSWWLEGDRLSSDAGGAGQAPRNGSAALAVRHRAEPQVARG